MRLKAMLFFTILISAVALIDTVFDIKKYLGIRGLIKWYIRYPLDLLLVLKTFLSGVPAAVGSYIYFYS